MNIYPNHFDDLSTSAALDMITSIHDIVAKNITNPLSNPKEALNDIFKILNLFQESDIDICTTGTVYAETYNDISSTLNTFSKSQCFDAGFKAVIKAVKQGKLSTKNLINL